VQRSEAEAPEVEVCSVLSPKSGTSAQSPAGRERARHRIQLRSEEGGRDNSQIPPVSSRKTIMFVPLAISSLSGLYLSRLSEINEAGRMLA
jgi:hypothetical protein